jgi:hypothetical protein
MPPYRVTAKSKAAKSNAPQEVVSASRVSAMTGVAFSQCKRALAIGCSLCVSTFAAAYAQQTIVNDERGREFALELCADCHVVASDQHNRPVHVQQIPSFAAIANRRGTTSQSLHVFIRTTHSSITQPGNMPILEVPDYEIDEIIDYILSLRKKG